MIKFVTSGLRSSSAGRSTVEDDWSINAFKVNLNRFDLFSLNSLRKRNVELDQTQKIRFLSFGVRRFKCSGRQHFRSEINEQIVDSRLDFRSSFSSEKNKEFLLLPKIRSMIQISFVFSFSFFNVWAFSWTRHLILSFSRFFLRSDLSIETVRQKRIFHKTRKKGNSQIYMYKQYSARY